jgi:hypothetical protein
MQPVTGPGWNDDEELAPHVVRPAVSAADA